MLCVAFPEIMFLCGPRTPLSTWSTYTTRKGLQSRVQGTPYRSVSARRTTVLSHWSSQWTLPVSCRRRLRLQNGSWRLVIRKEKVRSLKRNLRRISTTSRALSEHKTLEAWKFSSTIRSAAGSASMASVSWALHWIRCCPVCYFCGGCLRRHGNDV